MRVLVIESEHKIANVINRGLTQETYEVDVAYDGDSGLSSALTGGHDIIILDRMLAGSMEGLAICKEVRQSGIHTPILLLTAKDQVRDRVAGLNAGADDFLIKPFTFGELLTKIQTLLGQPKDAKIKELKVKDLSLDPVKFEVKRGNTIIKLSRREFALLEYLMRNSNRVLGKDSIISHVWNFDADILPNTVEVYMGYLRNKIDKPFKGPHLINTVRGFGYRVGGN